MFSTLNGLWDFKDVNRRIFSNNVLLDNAFNIAKDPKKKKLLVVVLKMKIFLIKNQQKNYRNQLLKTTNKYI